MHNRIFQHPQTSMGIHLVMGIILGLAAYALVGQIPNGDFAALFNSALVERALNDGQTNMLTLTIAAFGVALGSNYFISGLGKTLHVPSVGKVVVALIALVVIGGLVIGVTADWLTGLAVPMVMNPGMGLIVGSGLGWVIANELPQQPVTVWSVGVIAALVMLIALAILR